MPDNITSNPDESLHGCDRRQLLATLGIAGTLLGTPLVAAERQPGVPQPEEPFPKGAAEALARLKAGNARFVDGKTRHAHESANWRKQLVGGQKPFATILGCSDSRAPTELVFDQGFGDLFVIRVAGNVIAPDVVASLVYAGRHLDVSLFVVMGHTGCGAVTAAVDAKLKKSEPEPEVIETLLKLIEPGLKDVNLKAPYPNVLAAAVEANVRLSVKKLADYVPKKSIQDGRIILAGAIYDLATGRVRFLTS